MRAGVRPCSTSCLVLLALLLLAPLPVLIPVIHAQTLPAPSVSADKSEITVNQGETFTVTFTARNLGGTPNDRGWSYLTISVSGGLEIVSWTRWSDRDKKFNVGDPNWHRDGRQIPAQNEMVEAYASFPAGTSRVLSVTFRAKSPGSQWINFRFTLVNFIEDENWGTAQYYRDPSSSGVTDQQGWPVKRINVVAQTPLPDLTVTEVSAMPTLVYVGDELMVIWVESNQGSGNAGQYHVGIYLGGTEYGRDFKLGQYYSTDLSAGSSRSRSLNFTVPNTVPAGTYYVTVFIDEADIVRESNENNNIGSTTLVTIIVVQPHAAPDLTVSAVSFSPSTVSQGGSITVGWTEANRGDGPAGPYRVGVYLGTSEYRRDYLLGNFSRNGLAAGASQSYTNSFTVSSSIPPGTYYVTVFIDDLNAVTEANEDNNIGSSTPNRLTILQPTFRVKILSFDPPSSASPGQTVSVPLTVRYDFPSQSNVAVVISRRLADDSYIRVWYNPDYETPRTGQGTLSYTASFQVPSEPGTHSYRIRAFYWDGQQQEWIPTDVKYFSIVVQQPTQLAVDVWTNKGGQGRGNLNGGQYNIGEPMTFYCSININVDSLRIKVIRPDGAEVIVLERGPSSAGVYTASGTIGEPAGERRVICEARSGGQTSSDEVRYVVVQPRDTTPPTVRVVAPNGGEQLFADQVFRIRWEASDNVGVAKVHIWLFQGDTQVMVIARDLPNTGYYDWTVPNRPGSNYKVRIAAVDAAGNAAHDDSDGTFEVKASIHAAAQIVSLSTDKSQYSVGETVGIQYTIRNIGNVRLNLRMVIEITNLLEKQSVYDSHMVGQDRQHILDPGQIVSGEFTWSVPADATPGVYEVRASIRDWTNWDKIYDYRWGDRGGPRFTVIHEQPIIALVNIKPDIPTIDDLIEFTVLVASGQSDSDVNIVNLYVDGVLVQRWQGAGIFTYSNRYAAGIHTYYLVITDNIGREHRVPDTGEFKFNVLIGERVAGPPTLRIAPFEVVVEYEGRRYRALYAENVAVTEVSPDPNKDRRAFYTWTYSKRNWYVLDSNNQVVTDEDTYIKVAKAALVAYTTLIKHPEYLKETARFFKDVRDLGLSATILKKLGGFLASLIPTIALGGKVLPSSAGVERFGVIVKFISQVKQYKDIMDVDWIITQIAHSMLMDAEESLLRASKLAEPVYNSLMSDLSIPKAHVSYSMMIELHDLIKKEAFGFAAIRMLSSLHEGGIRAYLKEVIAAIVESADPSGIAVISNIIQQSPTIREFIDLMAAAEAEQNIREEAFENGARSFAKIAREYAGLVGEGYLGGAVTIRDRKITLVDVYNPDIKIEGEVGEGKVVLTVSSHISRGKTITVDLDKTSLPINEVKDIIVLVNGKRIKMAKNYADVINPTDDEDPEYFILQDSRGVQILISIPRFSTNIIEIMTSVKTPLLTTTTMAETRQITATVHTSTVIMQTPPTTYLILLIITISLMTIVGVLSLSYLRGGIRRKPRVLKVA